MPKKPSTSHALRTDQIIPHVHFIRNERVILDRDLAQLYGVETRALKQAVRRNAERFPDDFMFVLSTEEFEHWRSQNVISKSDRKGLRHPPMAFTEQGVAMLSSVLRSPQAVEVNIAIMRTFVQLRHLMDSNKDLARKIKSLENKYDEQFDVVFKAIQALIQEEESRRAQPKKQMGFHVKEAPKKYRAKKKNKPSK
jgi:hypothetical protein